MATPIVLQPKLNRLATNWAASNRRRCGSCQGRESAGCLLRRKRPNSMDELLREFLTETGESLDVVDVELVRFEQEPNNTKILDNIFRLVHTIKGTCGFLGLPRLEALTHAAETLMGNFAAATKPSPARPSRWYWRPSTASRHCSTSSSTIRPSRSVMTAT